MLEGKGINGDNGVVTQHAAASINTSATVILEGVKVESAANLPIGVADGNGVATSREKSSVGEVA